jgi:uncharacterized protein YbaA (DUF1428 family)
MAHADGCVFPVPLAKLAAHRRPARKAGRISIERGALEVRECAADEGQPGKRTSFPRAVKFNPDEIMVFAWKVYRSRQDRGRINTTVMADPRRSGMSTDTIPFDGKRMFWGGFKPLVSLDR